MLRGLRKKIQKSCRKICLVDFYIGRKSKVRKIKEIYPSVKGKFRNRPILVKKWEISKIKLPLIWNFKLKEIDRTDNLLKRRFIRKFLKIRKNGGYFFGHLPIVRRIILFLEDLLTLRGLRSSLTMDKMS